MVRRPRKVCGSAAERPWRGDRVVSRPRRMKGLKRDVRPRVAVDDSDEGAEHETLEPDDFDGGYGPNSYFQRAMRKDD